MRNVPCMVRQAVVCDAVRLMCEPRWRRGCETHPEVANTIFRGASPLSLVLYSRTPSSNRISLRAALRNSRRCLRLLVLMYMVSCLLSLASRTASPFTDILNIGVPATTAFPLLFYLRFRHPLPLLFLLSFSLPLPFPFPVPFPLSFSFPRPT